MLDFGHGNLAWVTLGTASLGPSWGLFGLPRRLGFGGLGLGSARQAPFSGPGGHFSAACEGHGRGWRLVWAWRAFIPRPVKAMGAVGSFSGPGGLFSRGQ